MSNRFFPRYESYLITSRFGQRVHPITKIKTLHKGIDMTATNDGVVGNTDYITAHTGGQVEAVGYGVSAGYYVKIRVDENTLMVYYHMKSKSTLEKGSFVAKGDILGYMGKTGSATGPHLHFGIQHKGEWIDPEPWLDADWVSNTKMISISLPVLKRGAKGESVRSMQQLLIAKGFDCGEKGADGSFGGATLQALQNYQSSAGLEPDGSCGSATWHSLLGQ